MNAADRATSGSLKEAVEALLPALEAFGRFDGPDLAGSHSESWRQRLAGALPRTGDGLEAVLAELAAAVIPFGLRNGAPSFCGWVTTAPTTAGVAASLAATIAGSMRWWVQPFNYLEAVGLRWLAELCEIPASWQGTFASGGSTANLIGLGAARQHAVERLGRDSARDGLPPNGRWRIYASTETHHALIRAAGVLGLGRRAVASCRSTVITASTWPHSAKRSTRI